MSLLVRINLALLFAFLCGAGVAGYVSKVILESNARREATEQARLMMETASAARDYTSREVAPLLAEQLQQQWLPQSVPSYAATQSLAMLRLSNPAYRYKEATLNPTNPRDRAADWERDVIESFRNNGGTELIGVRPTQLGPSLFLARPLHVDEPQCLTCHGNAAAAPQLLRTRYGDANGFGWGLHEIVGSQIVSVPLADALKKADDTYRAFMAALAALFGVLFVVVNAAVYATVLRPIRRIARLAEQISSGDLSARVPLPDGQDDIARLGRSVEKLRRSLEKSLALLQRGG